MHNGHASVPETLGLIQEYPQNLADQAQQRPEKQVQKSLKRQSDEKVYIRL
jgi:hypothetical protein